MKLKHLIVSSNGLGRIDALIVEGASFTSSQDGKHSANVDS